MANKYIFLIHWNAKEAEEYAAGLRGEGYDVEVEARDGNDAIATMRGDAPDAIIIYLSREPALGRRTAEIIRRHRKLKSVPLIFVDGRDRAVMRAISEFEGARFTKSSELADVLGEVIVARTGVLSRLKRWF